MVLCFVFSEISSDVATLLLVFLLDDFEVNILLYLDCNYFSFLAFSAGSAGHGCVILIELCQLT